MWRKGNSEQLGSRQCSCLTFAFHYQVEGHERMRKSVIEVNEYFKEHYRKKKDIAERKYLQRF
jgi:hypothetical protein